MNVKWGNRNQSRSQRPRSFWLATGIATSGQVQLRKSAIHGLPVTLRMLRVKSDNSDWFWSRSIVFTKPFKTRMSLDLTRGPDFPSACQKGPLETRLNHSRPQSLRFFWSRGRRNGGLWSQPLPDVRKSRTSGNACVIMASVFAHAQKLIPREGREE